MDVGDLKVEMGLLFEQVDKRFEQVDKRFEQVDKRFEQIDKRFEQVDKRFEQVDTRFDALERRITAESETTRRYFDVVAERILAERTSLSISLRRRREVSFAWRRPMRSSMRRSRSAWSTTNTA